VTKAARASSSIRPQADLVQQWLAADGAIACFSSKLYSFSLNADRAPQLKSVVMRQMIPRVTGDASKAECSLLGRHFESMGYS
jgi:hypothetical protein